MAGPLIPSRTARRARVLFTGHFALQGCVVAVWGTRLPAVQSTAHLTAGGLAIPLSALSVSMVLGLQISGRLADRVGSARLLPCSAGALGLALVLLGMCRSASVLTLSASVFGMALGCLIVPLNAGAAAVQGLYGRPIMASMHSAYSFAALVSAAIATLTAGVSHMVVFAVVGSGVACTAVLTVPAVWSLPPLDGAPEAAAASASSEHGPLIWLLGAMAAAALISEGSSTDWSAVHVHALGAPAPTAAAAYTGYCLAVALGRLAGDRLSERFGAVTVVRCGAALAAGGLAVGLAVGTVPVALAGWVLFGLGLSNDVPILYGAAGAHGPRAVAAVATAGNVCLMAGPAVIGAISSVSSLPVALTLPVCLTSAVAVGARAVLRPAGSEIRDVTVQDGVRPGT